MIDPNEAPEGYVAVASTDSCKGCAFSDLTLYSRCSRPFCGTPCTLDGGRDDGQDVIFIRREAPAHAVMTPKQVRDAMFMSVMELHRLRDDFAKAALIALIADPDRADQSRAECARLSYAMADAMLVAKFSTMTWGQK